MEHFLHTRGPQALAATIFGLGMAALMAVAANSPMKSSHFDQLSGYGLIASASIAPPQPQPQN